MKPGAQLPGQVSKEASERRSSSESASTATPSAASDYSRCSETFAAVEAFAPARVHQGDGSSATRASGWMSSLQRIGKLAAAGAAARGRGRKDPRSLKKILRHGSSLTASVLARW